MSRVTTAELAAKLGISTRSVRDYASRGVFVREGKGFDEDACVRAYGASLRKAATGKRGDGVSTASEERARLARLQGDALEIRNKLARREVVAEAEVEAAWAEIVIRVRGAILRAPDRIAAELPHLSRTDVAAIDRHLREALSGLARGARE